MKQNLLFLLALTFTCCLLTQPLHATHNRSAEISYHFINANTLQASIITYTKASSTQADRDSLAIRWGDGSPDELISRTNGPINPLSGIPNGVALNSDIKKNIYIGVHTYTRVSLAPNNFYVISMQDPNRNAGISNMTNSVNVPIYVEDTIWFQNAGNNYGPALLYPPIDFGNVGDTFTHNPAAYDVEADSLTFDLVPPRQGLGQDVPGYISPGSSFFGGPSSLTIDHHNGEIVWATPQSQGIYNIAILIREYRDGVILSSMVRDMQIIVGPDTFTNPPLNGNFVDTTIAPGQTFVFQCSTVDPASQHIDTITAYGGPFIMYPDTALFPTVQGNHVTGTMSWTPGRNQYKRRETRIVSFRSQTNTPLLLCTIRAFRITVEDALFAGVDDIQNRIKEVRVYPNPATDQIRISLVENNKSRRIMICDVCGKEIYQDDSPGPDTDVDIRQFSSGIYLVKVFSSDGVVTTRFVKE